MFHLAIDDSSLFGYKYENDRFTVLTCKGEMRYKKSPLKVLQWALMKL